MQYANVTTCTKVHNHMTDITIACKTGGCIGWPNAVDIMNKSSNNPM